MAQRSTPDYAGQTNTFDIYDPGDISGAGNVDIYLDYSTTRGSQPPRRW